MTDLESQSEAIPPKEKKITVKISLTPETFMILEQLRLNKMGSMNKFQTYGQTLDEMLTLENERIQSYDWLQIKFDSLVKKGRKVMEKYVQRKSEKKT